jgi:multiple sugar transport system substrate-binding protein
MKRHAFSGAEAPPWSAAQAAREGAPSSIAPGSARGTHEAESSRAAAHGSYGTPVTPGRAGGYVVRRAFARRVAAPRLAGATFLVSVLLLLSCSQQHDPRETLTFWGLGSEGELVSKLIPEFERRNPNIHVVVQQIPWSAAHEKLLTAFVGESTPDAAQVGNTWIPELVTIRALADLTPMTGPSLPVDPVDYFPGIWATNVVGEKLYGIPWYVDTRVLFYRSDILAAVGYPNGPRTWAEWREAMQRIRTEGRSRWALLLPTNEWDPLVTLALTNHSTLLNADGTRGAFRQKEFAGAFDFYVDIFRSGFAPKVSNSQIVNLYQQFAQGDFAMYITGPWNVGEFRRRLPESMQDKWATAPMPARDAGMPTGISMAGGSSLVVFGASPHKDAARKLIEFLSEPAQQVRFFELTGDLPARRSAWSSPALVADKHFPAFRAQLEHVAPMPKVPEWEQIATAIFDRGEAAARGATQPAVALAQLDARADELLEKRRWMLARQKAESPAPARAGARPATVPQALPVASAEPSDRSCVDVRPALRPPKPAGPPALSGGAPSPPTSRGRTSLNPPPLLPQDLSGDLVCCDGDWLP